MIHHKVTSQTENLKRPGFLKNAKMKDNVFQGEMPLCFLLKASGLQKVF